MAADLDTGKLDVAMAQNEDFQSALTEVRQWRKENDAAYHPSCSGEDDFQMNFLGSGAAVPSKYRNGKTREKKYL